MRDIDTRTDPLRRHAYQRWRAMVQRCTNPTHKDWKYYGGRGITVCARWLGSFEAYYADTGDRPAPGMSIDRQDNDGNYELSNVRWATPLEQTKNRRYLGPVGQTRINAAKTRCAKGHPYDAANTYVNPTNGQRCCRACNRAAVARYKARRQERAA